MTKKRFFLTRREQKCIQIEPINLCPNCNTQGYIEKNICKSYRKHIIFDLLKEKADLFFQKMLERKLQEEEEIQIIEEDDPDMFS